MCWPEHLMWADGRRSSLASANKMSNWHDRTYSWMGSEKQERAWLLNDLKLRRFLYWTHDWTGSQCRAWWIRGMSDQAEQQIRRAALPLVLKPTINRLPFCFEIFSVNLSSTLLIILVAVWSVALCSILLYSECFPLGLYCLNFLGLHLPSCFY